MTLTTFAAIAFICLTVIILYALSITKSEKETRRLEAEEKMYKAKWEYERSIRPIRPPHK